MIHCNEHFPAASSCAFFIFSSASFLASAIKKERFKRKYSNDFWHRKLPLKVKFWHFLTPPHYSVFEFFCSKTIWVQKIVEMGSFTIKIIISTCITSFRKFWKYILFIKPWRKPICHVEKDWDKKHHSRVNDKSIRDLQIQHNNNTHDQTWA